MGKEFKNIDDLFRSELGGNTQKAPQFVKDNIDAALGFNKRRYGWLFAGLFTSITALTLGLLWLMNDKSFDQLAHSNSHEISKENNRSFLNTDETIVDLESIIRATSSEEEIYSTSSNINDQQVSNDILKNTHANGQINKTSITSGKQEVQVDFSENKDQIVIKKDDNRIKTEIQSENIAIIDDKKKPDQDSIVKDPNSDVENSEDMITMSRESGADNNDISKESNAAVETSIKSEDDAIHNDANDESLDPEEAKLSGVQTEIDTTELEKGTTESSEEETVDAAPDSTAINSPIQPKPDDYKPWMMSVSTGITKARTKYTSTDMLEETYYNNSITDGLGWQFNTDVTYRLRNGLTFGTGIGYTQLNSKYDYSLSGATADTSSFYDYEYDYELVYDTYLSTTIDSSEFVWEVEYVSDSTAYIVDSTLVTTIDSSIVTNSYTGRNQVGYFQIPVSLGTQMQFGKFQLDLFAQTRFNFLIQSKGALVQGNSLFNYNKTDGIYRPFYMDVMLGARMHYAIFDRLYINASFQYRPVIGSAYQSTSLTKSFDYFHTGVGLSWRF